MGHVKKVTRGPHVEFYRLEHVRIQNTVGIFVFNFFTRS